MACWEKSRGIQHYSPLISLSTHHLNTRVYLKVSQTADLSSTGSIREYGYMIGHIFG